MLEGEQSNEKRKRISCGLYDSCPVSLKTAIQSAFEYGFHFIVTQLSHPSYIQDLKGPYVPYIIGRSDRVLTGNEWNRLIVGELSTSIDVDNEDAVVSKTSKQKLEQELGFASHLGVPAILIHLTKPKNVQLSRVINDKLVSNFSYAVWVQIPMVHESQYKSTTDIKYDSWNFWNDFRIHCDYDKRVGVVLELPDVQHVPPCDEIDRWVGEPVKALVIQASYFLTNQYGKPVLPKVHQEIIKRFMALDVQYIIHLDVEGDYSFYVKYMTYLGKKLYCCDTMAEFVQGCEDYLQNPLQPLSEHLEMNVYEVFEKDRVKYDTYQKAVHKALELWTEKRPPVVMVVGAGRGPLVQAVLNVSRILDIEVKVYAVEKNPYAVNTLAHRVMSEWGLQVTLVKEDMRTWQAPESADILVSELLGSFGDNELSPECLDGAQRFLTPKTGISIPCQYTSFLAPLQSLKIYNEIRNGRLPDKTLKQCLETPYVVHLANYQQLAPAQPLFTFDHPNYSEDGPDNTRYKSLKFPPVAKSCVLTAFVGFFETNLFDDVTLSTNPKTHTPDMVRLFCILN